MNVELIAINMKILKFTDSTNSMTGTGYAEPYDANNNVLLNTPINLEEDPLTENTRAVNEQGTSHQTSHHSGRSCTQNDDGDDLGIVRVAKTDLAKIFVMLESQ
ncbi:hypothetical protein HAX54_040550 [Datura stramonium]|uniref:Uncharacterized protein n=1 Tax=Datura stramonium TaxID=4076 RepID=A0ABS8SKC1_DATST|nr:hypothetical protein [Datura stramonium]